MRHLKAGRTLGVKPAHRRAMLRNIVTSLIEKERIRTTLARAKELRKPLDRMITLGKQGDLSARRQALRFIKSKEAMAKLFGDFAERYEKREGGFSRILQLGPRRGDGAEMALVILVGSPDDPFADESKPKRPGGRRKSKPVLDEVAAEVRDGAAGGEEGDANDASTEDPPSSSNQAVATAGDTTGTEDAGTEDENSDSEPVDQETSEGGKE